MPVRESGRFTDVSLRQPEKALSPMVLTEAGIVTVVRDWQPRKAASPISGTFPTWISCSISTPIR